MRESSMLSDLAHSVAVRVVAGILAVIGIFAYNNREIPELSEMCEHIYSFDRMAFVLPATPNLEAVSYLAGDLRIRADWRAYRISLRNSAAADSVARLGKAAGELEESALSGDEWRLSEAFLRVGIAMGEVRYACRYDNKNN